MEMIKMLEKGKFKMGENFKANKKLLPLVFVLAVFLILVISFVSSQYVRAFPSFAQGSQFTPISTSAGQPFPLFDRALCEAGQDFLLQIDPLGCQPTVVRSDLLEDQDVAVFCPVVATQLNPLIDIQTVNNIYFTFEGPRSEGVKGIVYFPARAALGRSSFFAEGQVNQPIFNNIGYAVIIFQRQPDERAIPDFFEGNLTARIRYDIQNAFGVGRATYYLPVLNDQEWEENFVRYEFWNGRGYLRANSVDAQGAGITVYSDREDYGPLRTGNLREIASVSLNKGETSREIPLPGFNFCLGTMKLKLTGIENPSTRAKLRVNEDVIEVTQGENFLENKCRITSMEKQGVVEKALITCQEDQRGSTFLMSINPRVKLTISEQGQGIYSVGQRLYDSIQTGESVYLAYIGSSDKTKNQNSLFVYTISVPGTRESLTPEELSRIACFLKENPIGFDKIKQTFCYTQLLNIISLTNPSSDFKQIFFSQPASDSFGKLISLDGYADAVDSDFSKLSEDFRSAYDNSMRDYNDLRESYSNINYSQTSTLGEQALRGQIQLTASTNQMETAKKLCDEFKKTYPGITPESACAEAAKFSSIEPSVRDVVINGRVKRITFDGIIEPSFEDFGAKIEVKNKTTGKVIETYNLTKNEIIYLDKEGKESISLLDVSKAKVEDASSADSARVQVNLQREQLVRTITTPSISTVGILKKGFPETFSSKNYIFTLTEISLKQVAKVSVEPEINFAETRASFPFKIGVEKRGIQLSPEKTRERIDALNKTLEKWRSLSNNLGRVVQGFKAACLGVGTTLTIKNFFTNLGGKGIARQAVMREPEVGWTARCSKDVSNGLYKNVDACLLANSDKIEESVNDYAAAIEKQNQADEALRKISGVTQDGNVIIPKYIGEWKKQLGIQQDIETGLGITNITITTPDGIKEYPTISQILAGISSNTTFVTQLRDLQANSELLKSDNPVVKAIAEKRVREILGDIYVNSRVEVKANDLQSQYGVPAVVGATKKPTAEIPVTDVGTFGQSKFVSPPGLIPGILPDTKVIIFEDASNAQKYLLTLNENYVITGTLNITESGALIITEGQPNPLNLNIKKFDRTTYQNRFIDPRVRYYEAGTYKGLPAIVPFDVQNGWYVAVKSTLPIGGALRAFDDSGAAASYYICNVGRNGFEEFNSGIGDDICRGYARYAGQPPDFPGLSKTEAENLRSRAEGALAEASRAYRSGVSNVAITSPTGTRQTVQVGQPYVGTPDIQCQDFMSPTDCNILFNVCDPVVCPSSRCNLGGTYPVQDVVQSGIIGGVVLCLPNFPEVKVPVCLSAIHAGVEGLVSVLDSYQQCLQTSLETGQTVGICDEIHSIYMCDFFWRQSLPLVKVVTSQGIGTILGQGTRGGGEYLGVADAWQTADNSINYFTQYYAADSFKAFKARSVEDIGTEICKNFVSASYPGGNLIDRLTAPDSPPQFYGRFDEIPFTTATSPPTSQYKVFYHIYAGKELPAYYQVYLRGGATSFYQDAFARRIVAQGFIRAGEYATETRDLTAPAGFQEMCIVVNAQEECGFKQVTTDFGINYVTETFVAQEAKRTDITSEAACVSGTTNLLPLLSPNIQGGVEEAINPAIYNRGITRVCSTDNPGRGTDTFFNTNQSRWRQVGYCGDPDIKCWLDMNSVRDVIKSTTIEGGVDDATQGIVDKIRREGGFLDENAWNLEYNKIRNEKNPSNKIQMINQIIDRVFEIPRRGLLILERAITYKDIAKRIFQGDKPPAPEPSQISCLDCSTGLTFPATACNEQQCLDFGKGLGKECIFENGLCKDKPATPGTAPTTPETPREIRNSYNFDSTITEAQLGEYITAASQKSYAGRTCNCGENCGTYRRLIWSASNSYRIPDPVLLLSLMMQESSCDYTAQSGSSYGLMQISSWELCRDELGLNSINDVIGSGNINRNIDCGALILKKKYDQYKDGVIFNGCSDEWQNVKYFDWEAALRGYNGLGCDENFPEQDNFVTEVMRRFQCLKGEVTGPICD